MNRNLTPLTRRTKLAGATAAGTGDTIVLGEIDMGGSRPYEAAICTVLLGAITLNGVATLRVRTSDTTGTYGAGTIDLLLDDSGAIATAVAANNGTTDDSNKVLSLEVFRPIRRYLRFELVRATANVAVVGALNEQYHPTNSVVTQAVADGYATVVKGNNVSAS